MLKVTPFLLLPFLDGVPIYFAIPELPQRYWVFPQSLNYLFSPHYGVSQSFRRGVTSEATNGGATNEVIKANEHWRKAHHSGSRRPNLTICEHYTKIRLILYLLLIFLILSINWQHNNLPSYYNKTDGSGQEVSSPYRETSSKFCAGLYWRS